MGARITITPAELDEDRAVTPHPPLCAAAAAAALSRFSMYFFFYKVHSKVYESGVRKNGSAALA